MWEIIYLQASQSDKNLISINPMSLFWLAIIIIVLILLCKQKTMQQRQFQMKTPTVKTKLICVLCKEVKIRPWEKGDQLFRVTEEKCQKCKSKKMKIDGVWAESLEKKHL